MTRFEDGLGFAPERTIVAHISGGLGNQMFQYAAASVVAEVLKGQIALDLTWFRHHRRHQGFELKNVFGIDAPEVSPRIRQKLLGLYSQPRIRWILEKTGLSLRRKRQFVREADLQSSSDIFKMRPPIYMEGYWQTYDFIKSNPALIRNVFKFSYELVGKNSELAQMASQTQSVAVHIRRGDYFSMASVAAVHGVDLTAYYRAATQVLCVELHSPEFFIFSDDPSWVVKNLELPRRSVIVEHNTGEESYRDMQLMSLCKHHVIANSTFSWWGAVLGEHEQQVVYAPKDWFQCGRLCRHDLFPAGWRRL